MEEQIMQAKQSRRCFLTTLSSAGAVGIIGGRNSFAEEAPPETTTVRLAKIPSVCTAPQDLAGELLRAEGFSDVRYVPSDGGFRQSKALAGGEIDLALAFSPPLLIPIDAGDKITIIAGVHVGCFELLATERIHSIAELKGKSVGVPDLGTAPHVFVSTMAAHVGLDPAKDINWVTSPSIAPMELFVDGKIDAWLGFPPETTGNGGRSQRVAGRKTASPPLPRTRKFCRSSSCWATTLDGSPSGKGTVLTRNATPSKFCTPPHRLSTASLSGS
jgi:NitT/TauT family transport system substrate-binding protein